MPSVNPLGPIRSHLQADRAAGGSTVAAAALAVLFAFAAVGTWSGAEHGAPGTVALAAGYTVGACLAALCALAMDHEKSVAMAATILAGASLISIYAVVEILAGSTNLLVAPLFVLPSAVVGLRGARALQREDLPFNA
jgi:hypothetical protein